MLRSFESEILDDPDLPDELAARAYRDIAAIHTWMGNVACVRRAIRRDARVERILDVGCGTGLVLDSIGRRLGVEAIGVDLHPRRVSTGAATILRADARFDALPQADFAYCMFLCHHLEPMDVIRMIRNVGRYCRRFLLLDLVRRRLPLRLFQMFVAPFVCPIDAHDGVRSIERAYTPGELRNLVSLALAGTGATFQLRVAPLHVRQVVEIHYGKAAWDAGSVVPERAECPV